jgi:hypothetical protein
MVAARSRFRACSGPDLRYSRISRHTGNNVTAVRWSLVRISGSGVSDDFGLQGYPAKIRNEE